MITVLKWPLKLNELTVFKAPQDAEFLHIEVQRDQVCIWGRVDTNKREVEYSFGMYGTGVEIHPEVHKAFHLKTLLMYEGQLVCHVFSWSAIHKPG